MECFHASHQCFDEFDTSRQSKEVGHHFSPDRQLCLSLVDTAKTHYLYQVELPDGPYWEMYDIANWNNCADFMDSLRRSIELNHGAGQKQLHQKIMQAANSSPSDPQLGVVKLLQEEGFVGISYFNEHEHGRTGQESYMIFSEEDITILEREDIVGLESDEIEMD